MCSNKHYDQYEEEMNRLIAERLMSREYLGALMQESVVSNRKLDIPVDLVDVMLDPMYSPTWVESAWVTLEDDREVNDGEGNIRDDDNR
jgi:hypothetical protein